LGQSGASGFTDTWGPNVGSAFPAHGERGAAGCLGEPLWCEHLLSRDPHLSQQPLFCVLRNGDGICAPLRIETDGPEAIGIRDCLTAVSSQRAA
jgi:hypothetical protein